MLESRCFTLLQKVKYKRAKEEHRKTCKKKQRRWGNNFCKGETVLLNLVLSGRTEVDKTHVGILMLSFSFFPFLYHKMKESISSPILDLPNRQQISKAVLKKKKNNVSKAIGILEGVCIYLLDKLFLHFYIHKSTCIFMHHWTEKYCEFP